jgi:hypothetical protein
MSFLVKNLKFKFFNKKNLNPDFLITIRFLYMLRWVENSILFFGLKYIASIL